MSYNLYVVPTPIGNLDDITIRGLKYLTNADIIICEDTRSAIMLLKKLEIDVKDKKFLSYHKDNEHKVLDFLINEINKSTFPVLISEAGMPSISDPGFLLIRYCIQNNINIEVIPGASALLVASVKIGRAHV